MNDVTTVRRFARVSTRKLGDEVRSEPVEILVGDDRWRACCREFSLPGFRVRDEPAYGWTQPPADVLRRTFGAERDAAACVCSGNANAFDERRDTRTAGRAKIGHQRALADAAITLAAPATTWLWCKLRAFHEPDWFAQASKPSGAAESSMSLRKPCLSSRRYSVVRSTLASLAARDMFPEARATSLVTYVFSNAAST